MSQPVEVYPNSVPQKSSSHSNGSFGSVFIVLAVIVVISAIACFLGRLCNRRYNNHQAKAAKQSNEIRPKEREGQGKQKQKQKQNFQSREGDIEFGFDRRIPTAKVAANGDFKGARPPQNGEGRGEMRFADHDGEIRPGA